MNASHDFNPVPGVVELLEPGIRRILAPNPSPMTYRGTNTYLVGEGLVAVIDPGPDSPDHLRAVLAALTPTERITQIFVTHSHLDHSPLGAALSRATGAPILAFGNSRAGRSTVMENLAKTGLTAGGEGVDPDFAPHEILRDNETVEAGDRSLTALWTPGHFGNHLSFAVGDAVFSGDHVMGWATSLVSPPDGDLTDFMASTRRLATRNDRVFYPGHGAPVHQPAERALWLLDHRRSREAQILERLGPEGSDIETLTRAIYTDVPAALLPAAFRNVFAHLIDLHGKNMVATEPHLSHDARYYLR